MSSNFPKEKTFPNVFILRLIALPVSLLTFSLFAQNDTIWMPCTFYDYHADGTNPNFQQTTTGHQMGMIQNRIGSNDKPTFRQDIAHNDRLNEWYVPSGGTGATYDLLTARWTGLRNYNNRPNEWVGQNFNPNYDMANIVTYDSLPFLPADPDSFPPGTYYFMDTTFFPLDGTGFGNEPTGWSHNYSYTMEFHRMFQYRGGEFFRFWGDDDVWVFIDGNLVIDIGGIHIPVQQTIKMDSIAQVFNLIKGNFYRLDFFYAERQTGWAKCYITTNIITLFPDSLHINVFPNDTIYVGDTLLAHAQVFSDSGIVVDPKGGFEWGYIDLDANNPASTFSYNDDSATFIPVDAHTTVKIWATYRDTLANDFIITLTDTVDIVVLPGPPDRIVIEASPNKPAQGNTALWNENPLDQVVIGVTENYNEQFYAILRDKEQNWIGPADPIDSWTSDNTPLITARAGANPSQGQGRADRATWSQTGSANVTASRDTLGKTLSDAIKVILQGEEFRVISATYYETDTRPDGLIDKINVVIDDRLTVSNAVLDALYPNISLPSSRNFTFDRNDMTATGEGFSISVTQPANTTPNTAVSSTVDILTIAETQVPGVGAIAAASPAIKDSLAPVQIRAVYHPGINQATQDTLVVNFSENIKRVQSTEPFRFKDNSINYSMTLSLLTDNNNSMDFLVQSITGKTIPENGDSIWILKNGNVTDDISIVQNKDTKPIPLEVLLFPVAVTTVTYKETDSRPDGKVDLIQVDLNRDITFDATTFAAIASKIQLPAFRRFSSLSAVDFTDTDNGFDIAVSSDTAFTAVTNSDNLVLTDNINLNTSYTLYAGSTPILDSLAPVITLGTFYPKAKTDDPSMPDTLIVNFSEEVKVPSVNQPFKFFDIAGIYTNNYLMTLSPMGTSQGRMLPFFVVNTEKPYPQTGDSLWISGGSNVEDAISIKQDKDTKPALLIVKPYPIIVTITVLNPVSLSKPTIHPNLVNRYELGNNTDGTLIVIKISGHVEDAGKLSANLDILDAVGNVVRDGLEAHFVKKENSLAMVWDLRNRNNRFVGPAPYCGMIVVKNGTTILEQTKILIGVKF